MSNFCLSILKIKFTNEYKKEQTKKVYDYLYKNIFKQNTEFSVDNHHVKETFKILDKIYFNNNITHFIKESGSSITFNASSRLTKTAGFAKSQYYLDKYGNVDYGNFEIQISKPIINNIFNDKKAKSLKINGLHCYNKLDCYINLYQHEIIHLLITIFCTKDGIGMGGHTRMFKSLAYNLFGHTEYKHFLLEGDSINIEQTEKFNKLNIEIGDIVESTLSKKKGEVINITNKNVHIRLDNDKIWCIPYRLIDKINKPKNKKLIKSSTLTPEEIKNKLKIGDTISVKLQDKLQNGIVKKLGKSKAVIILQDDKKWYIPYHMIIIK